MKRLISKEAHLTSSYDLLQPLFRRFFFERTCSRNNTRSRTAKIWRLHLFTTFHIDYYPRSETNQVKKKSIIVRCDAKVYMFPTVLSVR